MESAELKTVNKVEMIYVGSEEISIGIQDVINNTIDNISREHNITVDDIDFKSFTGGYNFIVIRYHYTEYVREGVPVVPVRKFKIERIQTQIDRMTEAVRELLETFSDIDDVRIEEFFVYEDYESIDRDHGILIYSYIDYVTK